MHGTGQIADPIPPPYLLGLQDERAAYSRVVAGFLRCWKGCGPPQSAVVDPYQGQLGIDVPPAEQKPVTARLDAAKMRHTEEGLLLRMPLSTLAAVSDASPPSF